MLKSQVKAGIGYAFRQQRVLVSPFKAPAYYSAYARNKMESRKDQSESWAD
jgi:hypothetical protein